MKKNWTLHKHNLDVVEIEFELHRITGEPEAETSSGKYPPCQSKNLPMIELFRTTTAKQSSNITTIFTTTSQLFNTWSRLHQKIFPPHTIAPPIHLHQKQWPPFFWPEAFWPQKRFTPKNSYSRRPLHDELLMQEAFYARSLDTIRYTLPRLAITPETKANTVHTNTFGPETKTV